MPRWRGVAVAASPPVFQSQKSKEHAYGLTRKHKELVFQELSERTEERMAHSRQERKNARAGALRGGGRPRPPAWMYLCQARRVWRLRSIFDKSRHSTLTVFTGLAPTLASTMPGMSFMSAFGNTGI